MIVRIGGFPSDLGNRLASATNTFSASRASPSGAAIVDARVRVEEPPAPEAARRARRGARHIRGLVCMAVKQLSNKVHGGTCGQEVSLVRG